MLVELPLIRSGQRVANTPLSNIIAFMSNEKLFADTQNSAHALDKKKPFLQKDDNRHGSFKKRKHDKGKKANVQYKKKIRNSPASNLIWNTPFMVGIRGTNVLIIRKVKATSPVEPTATALILEDTGKVTADFLLLVVVMAAVAMAMVVVQTSILSKPKIRPSWLKHQQAVLLRDIVLPEFS
jgi:hypothetical protein